MKDLSLGTSKARNVFLYILSNSFFIICAVSGPQQLLWLLIPPLWHSSNFPMSRALNVSQRSQIATSFQRVVLSFIPAPFIVNKERSTLRSCSCNLPSSMRCFSLGPVALAFQVDWNTFSDSGGRKKKKIKCFKYFQGGRFDILGVQDIMLPGDGHFVQRCGGISLGQFNHKIYKFCLTCRTFNVLTAQRRTLEASHSVSLVGP